MRRTTPVVLAAIAAATCGGTAEAPAAASDSMADAEQKTRLVGLHDFQGRESPVVAVRSEEANGNWAYVGQSMAGSTVSRTSWPGRPVSMQGRLVHLSDPYNPREVGYYVPKPNETSHPVEKGQGVAIQMNDVDLDDRGLACAADRTGAGLFILQHTGTTARSGT